MDSRETTEREWLVYSDEEYYPWAEIVTAPTAEDAARRVDADPRHGLVVVPVDAIAHVVEPVNHPGLLDHLRRRSEY